MATKTVPGRSIRSIEKKGHWRAKRHWGPKAVDVPVSEFTAEQLKALDEDNDLVVSEITMEVPDVPEAPEPTKAARKAVK